MITPQNLKKPILPVSLLDAIKTYCTTHALLTPNSTIIVGLSGGPDSVFLVHVMHELAKEYNLTIIAAHLDHQWRANSGEDVKYCKGLADTLGITFVSRTIAELNLTIKANGSQEEIGRKARRYFFESVAQHYNSSAIALAHHMDDQQETFFIRLLRGASLTGLTGMHPKDGLYIRPLLDLYKQDIVTYLDTHGIAYLIDPTNTSDTYLRNRIRNHVLPSMNAADARFAVNFKSTISHLQETERFLDELTNKTFLELALYKNRWHVSYATLLNLHSVVRYRVIVHWLCKEKVPFNPSQTFFDEIIRFLAQPSTKAHRMHPTWSIVKDNDLAYITNEPR